MSNSNTTLNPAELSDEQLEALLAERRKKKEQQRDAYKSLTEESVPVAIEKLVAASQFLQQTKMEVFSFFNDLLQLKSEVYGVKDGQQSHTFSDDKSSITIGYRVNEGWDDTVGAGIKKVTNFIQSLAKDQVSGELVEMVFNLLKKDAKGNLRTSRVIELEKLAIKFNNPEFTDGVKIIMNAYKPVRSVWFIEATTTNTNGDKVSIPLSISAVDFPEGFEFDLMGKE